MKFVVSHPFVLVFFTVVLGLVSAAALKEASQFHNMSLPILLVIVFVVIFVNGLRFMVWGYVHKKYPLSSSYPISSLFFPAILIMSYGYGETVGIQKVLGAALISLGVAYLTYKES